VIDTDTDHLGRSRHSGTIITPDRHESLNPQSVKGLPSGKTKLGQAQYKSARRLFDGQVFDGRVFGGRVFGGRAFDGEAGGRLDRTSGRLTAFRTRTRKADEVTNAVMETLAGQAFAADARAVAETFGVAGDRLLGQSCCHCPADP
jgi:hypothetical protein